MAGLGGSGGENARDVQPDKAHGDEDHTVAKRILSHRRGSEKCGEEKVGQLPGHRIQNGGAGAVLGKADIAVEHSPHEVIIVGAGPAGLFAALMLIELGIRPIILERGKDVRARRRDLSGYDNAILCSSIPQLRGREGFSLLL